MEKEFIIIMMEKDMMVNGKMIKEKEKEYFIGMMENLKVINMKVILKMVKEKEKE